MQKHKINHFNLISIILTLLISFLFSCNLTKNVPEGKQLLIKNKVEILNKHFNKKTDGFSQKDIEQILKPRTNTKFLRIPLKLRIYNLGNETKINKQNIQKKQKCEKHRNKKQKRTAKKLRYYDKKTQNLSSEIRKYNRYAKKISRLQNKSEEISQKDCIKEHWTRRLGEPPVLSKLNDKYRNLKRINIFLKEKGFYNSAVDTLTVSKKYNKRKVIVTYSIKLEKPHLIHKIYYKINDDKIKDIILKDTINSFLTEGMKLDVSVLESECERITNHLKNSGYYNFSKELIRFSADTISKNKKDNLSIFINKDTTETSKSAFKKYIIKDVFIYPYFEANKALTDKDAYFLKHDTLIYYAKNDLKYHFLYNQIPRINPKAIIRGIYIKPGQLFNLKDINATYRYLVSLPIIQIANVKFTEIKTDKNNSDTAAYLKCEIRLTQSKIQSANQSFELTNTSGNFGIGGNFSYTHNNIFRGTEVLNFNTNLAFKRLTKNKSWLQSDTSGFFNSREYGVNFSLKFPRLFVPVPMKAFIKRRNPKTIISANYNLLQRPDYNYTIAGGNIGYYWNSLQTIGHAFLPLTADVVDLKNPSQEFRDLIKILHLEDTYETHFVIGSSYKFIFNNQFISGKQNTFLLTVKTKIAGNSLSALMKQLDKPKIGGSYQINNIVFAQFVKEDIEFRFHKKLLRENDKIAFRLYTGAAFPYGNLKVVPFGERYFVGGANSIRAWQNRTLGPGTYFQNDSIKSYPNQTSDIRLEANIEYRMKLFWKIEGALFVDVGNIWAINNQDIRPGAKFNINTFYKEIAVGTGYGLRFDLGFILLRADMGIKLIDPSLPVNHQWIYKDHNFSYDDWTLYFAIGYPF